MLITNKALHGSHGWDLKYTPCGCGVVNEYAIDGSYHITPGSGNNWGDGYMSADQWLVFGKGSLNAFNNLSDTERFNVAWGYSSSFTGVIEVYSNGSVSSLAFTGGALSSYTTLAIGDNGIQYSHYDPDGKYVGGSERSWGRLLGSDPIIFFDFNSLPNNFSKENYFKELKTVMSENGFSSNIKFANYGFATLMSWWNDDTYATVTLKKPSGVKELGLGGHTKPYSNKGTVLLRPEYNMLDYANITMHELGHGIFGFGDKRDDKSKGYIMYYKTQLSQSPIFTETQMSIIKSSIWGN
ncbi:MAG: hypothetical protein OEW75_00735 [Cyclobacteriaceae bacterium]|nr:hypothetical protein [Cyclobacteriaceae bacterium]